MVRAILDGLKTMTRRTWGLEEISKNPDDWELIGSKGALWRFQNKLTGVSVYIKCPYGQVGDRLWVRETFVLESTEEYAYAEPNFVAPKDRPTKYVPWVEEEEYGDFYLIPHYKATELEPNIVPWDAADFDRTRWAPSIHMPRWASRILLEITSVRAERNYGWDMNLWVWPIGFKKLG